MSNTRHLISGPGKIIKGTAELIGRTSIRIDTAGKVMSNTRDLMDHRGVLINDTGKVISYAEDLMSNTRDLIDGTGDLISCTRDLMGKRELQGSHSLPKIPNHKLEIPNKSKSWKLLNSKTDSQKAVPSFVGINRQ